MSDSSPQKSDNINSNLNEDLNVLETRGLLHWNCKTNRYDILPIVRRYVYERLTTS